MYTCPENSGSHLWLEDEPTEEFLFPPEQNSRKGQSGEYAQRMRAIQAVRAVLREDAESLSLSREELEAGYERLLSRMRYHHVCSAIQRFQMPLAALPWAAAVALVIGGVYFFLHKPQTSVSAQAALASSPAFYTEAIMSGATPKAARQGIVVPGGADVFPLPIAASGFSVYLPGIPDIDVFKPPFVYAPEVRQRVKKLRWQTITGAAKAWTP